MNFTVLLAQSPSSPPAGGGGTALLVQMVPLVIIMIGFLYVSTRMQKKKANEHEQKLKSLKPGDKIATSGGILGTVITVKEKSISIRSADSKLEISKGSVSEVLERGSEASSA
jgi:preprotein translocase subunit YajC